MAGCAVVHSGSPERCATTTGCRHEYLSHDMARNSAEVRGRAHLRLIKMMKASHPHRAPRHPASHPRGIILLTRLVARS